MRSLFLFKAQIKDRPGYTLSGVGKHRRWRGGAQAQTLTRRKPIPVGEAFDPKGLAWPTIHGELAVRYLQRHFTRSLTPDEVRLVVQELRDAAADIWPTVDESWERAAEAISAGGSASAQEYLMIDEPMQKLILRKLPDGLVEGAHSAEDYKHAVVTKLAAGTGVDYDHANEFVQQWAHTSNDTSRKSLEIQEAVSQEFGVPMSEWQTKRLLLLEQQAQRDVEEFAGALQGWGDSSVTGTQVRALVRAMYTETQRQLKELGITELVLHRGVITNTKAPTGTVVSGRELSNSAESWSSNAVVARNFADQGGEGATNLGLVLTMKVPAARILSTPSSGFGCLAEQEFVVLGNPEDTMLVTAGNVS